RGRSFHWVTLHINTKIPKQLEINFDISVDNQKYIAKIAHYGVSPDQAELIAKKEKEADFDKLITDLNAKVRSGKLKIDKSVAYLIGIYQKKGILPNKG
ncbi:hypothetical protein, partial [Meiothermus sp. Pnk-1]